MLIPNGFPGFEMACLFTVPGLAAGSCHCRRSRAPPQVVVLPPARASCWWQAARQITVLDLMFNASQVNDAWIIAYLCPTLSLHRKLFRIIRVRVCYYSLNVTLFISRHQISGLSQQKSDHVPPLYFINVFFTVNSWSALVKVGRK